MVFKRDHSDKEFSFNRHTQHTASIYTKGKNVGIQYNFSAMEIMYFYFIFNEVLENALRMSANLSFRLITHFRLLIKIQ